MLTLNADQAALNDGFAEGVSYRGRLLIAMKCQILDSIDNNLADVTVEPIAPVNENAYGKSDEFLAFMTIYESNMIDRRFSEKQISYELTIGNDGLVDEGPYIEFDRESLDGDSGSSEKKSLLLSPRRGGSLTSPLNLNGDIRSTTPPLRPMMSDKQFYHLPIEHEKMCLYLKTTWPDHRARLYRANVVAMIAEQLEVGLADVEEMVQWLYVARSRRMFTVLRFLLGEARA